MSSILIRRPIWPNVGKVLAFVAVFPLLASAAPPPDAPLVTDHLASRFKVKVDLLSPIKTANSPDAIRTVVGHLRWNTPTTSNQWSMRLVLSDACGATVPPDRLRINGVLMSSNPVIQLHKGATSLRFEFEAHGQAADHLDKVTAYLCDSPTNARGAGQQVVVIPSKFKHGLDIFSVPFDGGYIPITQVQPPSQTGQSTATIVKGTVEGSRLLKTGETVSVALIYGPTYNGVMTGMYAYGNVTSGVGWKSAPAGFNLNNVSSKTQIAWQAQLGQQPPHMYVAVVVRIASGTTTNWGRLGPTYL